jgi:hypothetical protein
MELHERGKSLGQIAAMLNDGGTKPKRGNRWVHKQRRNYSDYFLPLQRRK